MPTTKKNVLITGVTSSIGRNLTQHLIQNPRVGFILGLGRDKLPYYFKDLDRSRFLYRNCNILKYRELKNLFLSRVFKDCAIDTVVHLAFHNRQMHGKDVHLLNVHGTKNLIEACIGTGTVTKFVFKSS